MMLHTKYQDSRPYGLRQEDFFMFLLSMLYRQEFVHVFHYISLYKTCDPQGGAIFGPQGHD